MSSSLRPSSTRNSVSYCRWWWGSQTSTKNSMSSSRSSIKDHYLAPVMLQLAPYWIRVWWKTRKFIERRARQSKSPSGRTRSSQETATIRTTKMATLTLIPIRISRSSSTTCHANQMWILMVQASSWLENIYRSLMDGITKCGALPMTPPLGWSRTSPSSSRVKSPLRGSLRGMRSSSRRTWLLRRSRKLRIWPSLMDCNSSISHFKTRTDSDTLSLVSEIKLHSFLFN